MGRLRGAFARGVYSFKGIRCGASTRGSTPFLPPLPLLADKVSGRLGRVCAHRQPKPCRRAALAALRNQPARHHDLQP